MDVTLEAIRSFASKPASQHIKLNVLITYVPRVKVSASASEITAEEKNTPLPCSASLLLQTLSSHPVAKTPLGKDTLDRFRKELGVYYDQVGTS